MAHQDLIQLFAGKGLRVESNHFGVYKYGGAQLSLTGPVDHVSIANNVFVGTDSRLPGYRARMAIIIGVKGSDRLPRFVEVVNNTILTGFSESTATRARCASAARTGTGLLAARAAR